MCGRSLVAEVRRQLEHVGKTVVCGGESVNALSQEVDRAEGLCFIGSRSLTAETRGSTQVQSGGVGKDPLKVKTSSAVSRHLLG